MRQDQSSTIMQLICKCFKFTKTKLQQYQMIRSPIEIPPQKENQQGRKTLIVDLDETLVHSSFSPMNINDMVLDVKIDDQEYKIYVNIRPGAKEFLKEASIDYEIIIFTASVSEYANPVIDFLDENGVVELRLFRENCTICNGVFGKDLSLFKRDLSQIILVDNSVHSFMFQPMNAIHVLNYFQDKSDQELYLLLPFLKFMSNVQDVRPVHEWLFKYVHFDKFEYTDRDGKQQQYCEMPTSSDTQREKISTPCYSPKGEEEKILIQTPTPLIGKQKNKETTDDEINEELSDKKDIQKESLGISNKSENENENDVNLLVRASINLNSPNYNSKQIIFPSLQSEQ